ncbi:DUF7706 family protein [Photorhabdus aegyptia]|uniref:DUF7706 family protein n=1 Tax=Photorhabdus aegyptia TaxID=2805098 RepID=UPI003B8A8036
MVIEHLQDIQLTHIEALALAQLVKRLNWAEIRKRPVISPCSSPPAPARYCFLIFTWRLTP